MSLRSLIANVALLLLSLSIAVVIWITAVREGDTITSINSVLVPLQPVGQAPGVNVTFSPQQVQISLEGPVGQMEQINLDEIVANFDISQAPMGESEFPITVPFDNDDIRISAPIPSRVTAVLEQIVTRSIPVVVNLRGTVARGHAQGDPLIEPETIEVTGAASRVDQLAIAEATINLDNESETIVRSPTIFFRDQSNRIASVAGLTLSNSDVQVTVPIDELAGFQEKPITARWTGEPAPGYRLINVTVEPSSALVTGRSIQLDLLGRINTEEINIDGLTQSLTQQVSLDLPDGVELEEFQPVIMTVEIEPILTTAAVRKAPQLLGLGEGLEAFISPEEVRIIVFGPLAKLDALDSTRVRVTLDLFGLAEGAYNVQPMVDIADDELEIRSWQPSVVSIVISQIVTPTDILTPTESLTPVPNDSVSFPLPPLVEGSFGVTPPVAIFPTNDTQWHGYTHGRRPRYS